MQFFLINALLALCIFKKYINGLNYNDTIKNTRNNQFLNNDTKFEASLKNFLKKNNMNDENKEDNLIEENKDFITKQMLSGLYNSFIVDVVNNSTLQFLDNLNSEKSGSDEFQIELEESCSPFFCEKVMKAKEIERSTTDEKENSDELVDDLNSNEKEIKLHDENKNDIVQSLDSINKNNANTQEEIDAIFSRSFDGNEEKQKIILTDGDNVYILEEITQNENGLNNEEDLNNKSKEQEIKMHIPSENEENNYLEDNFLDNNLEENDDLNNLQKDSEKGIQEHNLDNNYVNEKDSNENTLDDNIFELSDEELSKKIFEDIKMNSEDKVECYNFSKNEDKCNSFKKCTYVNIDNKDTCFLDYNYMLFLKNNNCALQSKSSLLSISKDLLQNEIISRQLFQLLRNSNNNNFICDTITYSFLTNVVDNTNYEEIFS
ncbi:conserved Plasmodium protein, unknown function [Plasmodium gallinaceum]|uniref:Uncharacterized protein n=1 Tax=Plasmodium gallinaceum TaxID=5849 RepID=A0A1J1H0V1_PLAGA|nr:conserved Plasmodium protein, unknown function [Plasmodium gallinaceum]CRG98195.1 conserved Plasmodium protein, unknown function [Plasmodium gallinaceum]